MVSKRHLIYRFYCVFWRLSVKKEINSVGKFTQERPLEIQCEWRKLLNCLHWPLWLEYVTVFLQYPLFEFPTPITSKFQNFEKQRCFTKCHFGLQHINFFMCSLQLSCQPATWYNIKRFLVATTLTFTWCCLSATSCMPL